MPINQKKYPLDKEVLAYLERCEALYPKDNGKLDVESNRALYLTMCEAFQAPIPDSVTITDASAEGRHGAIPVRRYRPLTPSSDTTVVYYHGGGFVIGDLDSHHSICADIAFSSGCEVVAVDYRLVPEHPHPVPFEDALDAFKFLDKGQTIVAGDSAGGTLSAAVCVATTNADQSPIGQVLIYPWLGGELFNLDSYHRNGDAPGLTVEDLAGYSALRTRSAPDKHDPTYYPLAAGSFAGLPPCIALAAEFDPLFDDAIEYVKRLQAAGVDATCHIDHGLIHGHLRARHMSQKVALSFERICEGIRSLSVNASSY